MDRIQTPSSTAQSHAPGPALSRVEAFRRLFLLFALGSLVGVLLARVVSGSVDPYRLPLMAGAVLGLGGWWLLGHRRGDFPAWAAPLEGVILLVFAVGLKEPLDWLGVCYVATQYRAVFGSRRTAMVTTAVYSLTYALGLAIAFGFPALLRPITVVHLFALALGPYVAATLVYVLRRHARQMDELRSSQHALRESEQRFRAVADCLREALLITDTEDRIILANERVRDVLGYEPNEVVGRIASDLLLPASQRHAFSDRMRRRLRGDTELYDQELIRKDGTTMYAEISASPYRDTSGEIVGTMGAISDISDRKRLEERLRQSMRLEAVGQLAGGVAHDFNNLLTIIKCHTELMLADLPPQAELRDNTVEIDRAVDKGALLIQQLLAFGRRQMLQPRPLTLAQSVAEATPILRGLLPPGVQLVVNAAEPGAVFADPMQMEQVLVTLVRNANEAMPEGGRIVVETHTRSLEADDPRVLAGDAAAGRYSVLAVSDNGTGMGPEVLSHLFEPFFTTKAPGDGSGLGLAGLYGIVRQSGGFVDVESLPKLGTTFRVYLPSREGDATSLPTARRPELQST